jgi:hypothetical protein
MNMPKFQFFGVDPILVDKVVFYTERNAGGKYVYQSSELTQLINGYKNANDNVALDQILRELFWICNQGRRPWSLEAEQSFLALASAGYDLLAYLRSVGKISNETYAFINPLDMTLRLEYEAEHLRKVDDLTDSKGLKNILAIFYRLIHVYISVFDCWVSDFPQMAKLPAIDSMKYLLETGNDSEFAVLLTAFAKTKDPIAKNILIDFSNDDEQEVQSLAKSLLARYP